MSLINCDGVHASAIAAVLGSKALGARRQATLPEELGIQRGPGSRQVVPRGSASATRRWERTHYRLGRDRSFFGSRSLVQFVAGAARLRDSPAVTGARSPGRAPRSDRELIRPPSRPYSDFGPPDPIAASSASYIAWRAIQRRARLGDRPLSADSAPDPSNSWKSSPERPSVPVARKDSIAGEPSCQAGFDELRRSTGRLLLAPGQAVTLGAGCGGDRRETGRRSLFLASSARRTLD